jgi:uncharacterized membrane protein YkoI
MTNPLTKLIWRGCRALLCALTLSAVSGLSHADNDQDRARQALQAGEVLPLGTVLERVEKEVPGQILDVDLDRETEDGVARWVYKIKLLRTDGGLVKLKVDARSGVLLSQKGRHHPPVAH